MTAKLTTATRRDLSEIIHQIAVGGDGDLARVLRVLLDSVEDAERVPALVEKVEAQAGKEVAA